MIEVLIITTMATTLQYINISNYHGVHLNFTQCYMSNTDGPQLNDGSTYDFSTLRRCENDSHSVEIVLQILNFDLFPG